jgi:hypothetical protein
MAALIYIFEPKYLPVIQSAPAVFFVGSLLTFGVMVINGAVLAPVSWFVLGAGIYFGLGSLAGGLNVHPYSNQLFGADTLYLTRVNLLNACSVIVVIGVAHVLDKILGAKSRVQGDAKPARDEWLLKIFPYLLAVAAVGCGMKYAFFPIAESLLLRSVMGKIHMFVPASFLLLGMLWLRISWRFKAFALVIFVLEIINGLLVLSKYQVVYAMLALVMGMWMASASWRSISLKLVSLVLVFSVINPLITLGRAHMDYDSEKNTLANRVEILRDVVLIPLIFDEEIQATQKGESAQVKPRWASIFGISSGDLRSKFGFNLKEVNKPQEQARAIGRRFEVASIQGYLINEYNSGRPGNTLSNFWVTFVPRIFWPQKPVITQPGGELHKQYFNDPNQVSSSLAPTYSAEAYWNFGPAGVVVISALIGLAIGWLTHYSFLAVSGARPEYFIVAFSVAIWACFVESWLVSGYLGEFVIFVVILMIAHIVTKFHDYLKNKEAWRSPGQKAA